ncbi:biotin transporter BioY [Paracidobacterium acidisoli]|uniref:Biotin transporter n=1 Tax=Paracidobacterium acidisoli TaxID=2303751 RepID=A0A372IKG1_9BACT|nr:biotin transporter BioY [Paracidobacterium acidisoli]MBT9332721.1 biotin transporter BioY [Paracidobacterium acidisoli]
MNFASSSATSQGLSLRQNIALRKLAAVLLGSAFVGVCAHIAVPIPISPVPLTLQTFAVLLIGLAFGPPAALTTLALYLFEGLAGLPVFSPHGPGGVLQIMGPTGGYLLSYPPAAALTGWLFRATRRHGMIAASLSAAAGSLFTLAAGATWLAMLTHLHARAAFSIGVLPFLPGDLLKTLAAGAAGAGIWRFRQRRYRAN